MGKGKKRPPEGARPGKAAPEKPQPLKRGVTTGIGSTRREWMNWMVRRATGTVVGLTGAAIYWAMRPGDPENGSASPPRTAGPTEVATLPEVPPPDPKILDLLPTKDVPLPVFTEIEHDVPDAFPVPARLQAQGVNEATMNSAMFQLNFYERFKHELLPKFREGLIQENDLVEFLQKLINENIYFRNAGLDFKEYVANAKAGQASITNLLHIINAYLIHTNLFISHSGMEEDRRHRVNVLQVNRISRFKMTDGSEESTTLVISTRNGAVTWEVDNFDPQKTHGETAKYLPDPDYCTLDQDMVTPMSNALLDLSRKYNGPYTGTKPYRDLITESYLNHEMTHPFLNRKFPKTCKRAIYQDAPNYDLNTDLRPLTAKTHFQAVDLHELAAVAVELARSEERRHYRLYIAGYWGPMTEDHNYYLAKILLPVAILKVAKPSPARKAALADLEQGKINYGLLSTIFSSDEWTIEDTRRVGQLLYNFAHRAFTEIENTLP